MRTKAIKSRLNCPFCDEESIPATDKYILTTPDKIYVPRTCIMGHEFISVEYIPENQAEIIQEMKEIRSRWHENQKREKGGMDRKVGGTQRKNTTPISN